MGSRNSDGTIGHNLMKIHELLFKSKLFTALGRGKTRTSYVLM